MSKKTGFIENSKKGAKFFSAAGKYCYVPPGHYYSPVVNIDEAKQREDKIWKEDKNIKGIDLHVDEQKDLLAGFRKYYEEMPFGDAKKEGMRYYFDNSFYTYTDGIMLYCMMRHFKPKNIIEVGSGFSSAVMMDTRDAFKLDTKLGFIEPYPERLFSLMSEKDKQDNDVLVKDIQEVPLSYFEKLGKNDMLFIDSTHVSKTGSDVNYLFFEVLPILKEGVLVHIHDVFATFEYPRDWVYEGRSWNEDYMLRAFLMYNDSFRIKLFSNYIHKFYSDYFKDLPLCYNNTGGNIWIERTKV
ncbi:MAG: class I SAM-dependent methyltransferase [Bacteroidales bacterium]|nr:class I SAM-dependent methyltransferase [Bacteroidales bacterium]